MNPPQAISSRTCCKLRVEPTARSLAYMASVPCVADACLPSVIRSSLWTPNFAAHDEAVDLQEWEDTFGPSDPKAHSTFSKAS